MSTKRYKEAILAKTRGHCHVCGEKLEQSWQIDHVVAKSRSGSKDVENCLPSCRRCNRLKWHHRGSRIGDLLDLGYVASAEIKRKSPVGKEIKKLLKKRNESNAKRRKPKKVKP